MSGINMHVDRIRLAWLFPIMIAAVIYLVSTVNRAVIDYDEGHYSQAAVNMAEGGDWVTPYVNGVRFLEKPPLLYWFTAACFLIFGISEFALRMPTALGVIALVTVVTLMGRRVAGNRAAVIAGLSIACSAGTYLFTRETMPDIWLVLFVTLAMYAFLEWYLHPLRPRLWAMVFYASLAGAVLCKSLIGVAFPVGITALFFALNREWPDWRKLYLFSGGLLFLLIAAPWHWLAAMRNQGFLHFFFVNEQFLRFIGKHDPPVLWSLPIFPFWALVLVWFFPWTVFLPAAFVTSRSPENQAQRALVKLILAWVIVIMGFFSVSGRLEHYSFPVLPALSLLVGLALSRSEESRAVKWGFRGLAIIGMAALVTGLVAGTWFATAGQAARSRPAEPNSSIIYETDFSILADMPLSIMRNLLVPAGATFVTLAIGFCAAQWFETHRRRMQAVLCIAAVMSVICGMIQWSLVICEDMISSKKFGLAVGREARTGDHMVVVGDYESANSLNFYEPLRVEIFDGLAYAITPGMRYADAPRIILSEDQFRSLWNAEGRVFALMPRARLDKMKLDGTEMLRVLDRVLLRNR